MKFKSFLLVCWVIIPSIILSQSTRLTVTSDNLALIEENRTLTVKKGINSVSIDQIPKLIDPTSVYINFSDKSVRLIEQYYAFDLRTKQDILNKSVNQVIRFIHPDIGTIQGKVLSFNSTLLVLETSENEIRLIDNYRDGQIIVDKSNLVPEPTLFWQLESKRNTDARFIFSYLTQGIGWEAEYAGVLDDDQENMTLSAMVNIYNNCGKSFKESRLTLIAGELNRVKKWTRKRATGSAALMEMNESVDDHVSSFDQKESFEYYTYHLPQLIDLADSQEKQLPLFDVMKTTVNKSYVYNYQYDQTAVSIIFELQNTKDSGPGIPLPAGRIRVYQQVHDQNLILGEDRIPHTPIEGEIKIKVGKAFNIRAERRIVERKRESNQSEKLKISIEFRNHKREDITINVSEPVYPNRSYQILNSSHEVTDKNAKNVEFNVPVKSKKSSVLTYEILYTR